MLKTTYGATIFGLGDFHQLNLEGSNPSERHRTAAGELQLHHGVHLRQCVYNKRRGLFQGGLSQVNNINDALKELITQIDANVGEGRSRGAEHSCGQLQRWRDQLEPAGSTSTISRPPRSRRWIITTSPAMTATERRSSSRRPTAIPNRTFTDIGRGDAIRTSLNILPIPPQALGGRDQGRELRREGRHHHHRPDLHQLSMGQALDAGL